MNGTGNGKRECEFKVPKIQGACTVHNCLLVTQDHSLLHVSHDYMTCEGTQKLSKLVEGRMKGFFKAILFCEFVPPVGKSHARTIAILLN